MNGIWNCQIRFGALYLANAKILHFCSKKNMPVNNLARREFLYKIKERGLDIDEMQWYLENWHRTIPSNLLLSILMPILICPGTMKMRVQPM